MGSRDGGAYHLRDSAAWSSQLGRPAPFDETRGISLGRPGWTLLASSDLTGGAFELFEELRASPSGPPPHVHRDRDETFYVLEGRYAFTRGSDEIEVGPGQVVFVPRGTRHQYRTLVAKSRTLIIIAPAGLEAFFREMGARLAAGASPLEAMTALSELHDSHPVP
jgi:mannose-6-phosphate isomerase-like protein (cupin superfamily)